MKRAALAAGVVLALSLSHEAAAGTTVTTAWYSAGGAVDAAAVGDGLLVQGAPNGPLAESAVRIEVDDTAGLSLALHVRASDSVSADQAIVIACRTTATFASGGGQALAAAPAADCADAVTGVLSSDGSTMTFALGSFVHDGAVSVLLRPGFVSDRPSTVQGSTFRVVFDAPKAQDVAVTTGGPPAAAPSPMFEPAPVELPATPVLEPPAPADVPVTQPAPPAPAPAATAPTSLAPLQRAASTGSGSGAGWWALGLGVPLALLAWRPPARLRASRAGGHG